MKYIFCAVLFAFVSFSSVAGNRLALVIGNAAYSEAPLRNSVTDAVAVAAGLSEVGFDVVLNTDVNLAQLRESVAAFSAAIEPTITEVVFYYSGHGMQIDGKNYLVPIDAEFTDAYSIETSCFPVDWLYTALEARKGKVNIVILDCCRNNPFSPTTRSLTRGLSVVGAAPTQSLIIYATAANQVAYDGDGEKGIFAEAFIRHLKDDEDIEIMLRFVRSEVLAATKGKQNPYTYGSLVSGFRFPPDLPTVGSIKRSTITSTSSPTDYRHLWFGIGFGVDPKAEKPGVNLLEMQASYAFAKHFAAILLVGNISSNIYTYRYVEYASFFVVTGPEVRFTLGERFQPFLDLLIGYAKQYEGLPDILTYSGVYWHFKTGADLQLTDKLRLGFGLQFGRGYGNIFSSLKVRL